MHFVEQVGVIQKVVGLRWLCGKCYWASTCAMGAEVDAISTENCFQKMDKLCHIRRDSRQVCRANHPMPRFSVRKGKKIKGGFAQFLSWLRRQSCFKTPDCCSVMSLLPHWIMKFWPYGYLLSRDGSAAANWQLHTQKLVTIKACICELWQAIVSNNRSFNMDLKWFSEATSWGFQTCHYSSLKRQRARAHFSHSLFGHDNKTIYKTCDCKEWYSLVDRPTCVHW